MTLWVRWAKNYPVHYTYKKNNIPNVIQSSDNDRDLMMEICSVNLFKDVDFPLEKNNILHYIQNVLIKKIIPDVIQSTNNEKT